MPQPTPKETSPTTFPYIVAGPPESPCEQTHILKLTHSYAMATNYFETQDVDRSIQSAGRNLKRLALSNEITTSVLWILRNESNY